MVIHPLYTLHNVDCFESGLRDFGYTSTELADFIYSLIISDHSEKNTLISDMEEHYADHF